LNSLTLSDFRRQRTSRRRGESLWNKRFLQEPPNPWIRFWEERSPGFLSSDSSNPMIKRTRAAGLGLLESCHPFRTLAAAGHVCRMAVKAAKSTDPVEATGQGVFTLPARVSPMSANERKPGKSGTRRFGFRQPASVRVSSVSMGTIILLVAAILRRNWVLSSIAASVTSSYDFAM